MSMEKRTHHRWLATTVVCMVAGMLLYAVPAWSQQQPHSTLRNLTGIITDSGHEPIRGAIVELQNGTTNEVVTFITDASGRYNFKRMDGSTDYQVWVLFRGHRSATRNISKFDDHMAKVINFTVRTY
jgi:hypothetical protein